MNLSNFYRSKEWEIPFYSSNSSKRITLTFSFPRYIHIDVVRRFIERVLFGVIGFSDERSEEENPTNHKFATFK